MSKRRSVSLSITLTFFSTLCLLWFVVLSFLGRSAEAIVAQPAATPFAPTDTVEVQMYVLVDPEVDESNGGQIRQNPVTLCQPGSVEYGCTAVVGNANYSYPYPSSTAAVSIEEDYLLDVVAGEMHPALGFHLTALTAQAIAARSYTYRIDADGIPLNATE